MRWTLNIDLLSNATFARGTGQPGEVDVEIMYDERTGLPYIRGRSIKGLLTEACSEIVYALTLQRNDVLLARVEKAAGWLFGEATGDNEDEGALKIGRAHLPASLCAAIEADVLAKRIAPQEVRDALTTIRRQTSTNEKTGAPLSGSLRAIRSILRGTSFTASVKVRKPLDLEDAEGAFCAALLDACVAMVHRGGLGRNRGMGRLLMVINIPTTQAPARNDFIQQLQGAHT